MKLLQGIFFILVILLTGCRMQQDIVKKVKSDVDEVYVQRWTSGVRYGGAGINVYVSLRKKLPDSVVLTKVEFQKRFGQFQKTDDLHYQANIVTRKSGVTDEEDSATPTIVSDLNENQAKFFVEVNGKEYFYVIDSVVQKEALAYP